MTGSIVSSKYLLHFTAELKQMLLELCCFDIHSRQIEQIELVENVYLNNICGQKKKTKIFFPSVDQVFCMPTNLKESQSAYYQDGAYKQSIPFKRACI